MYVYMCMRVLTYVRMCIYLRVVAHANKTGMYIVMYVCINVCLHVCV